MPESAQTLRELLHQHRPGSLHVGYPAWLRERVGVFVRQHREAGETYAALAAALGVSTTTLGSWARALSTKPAGFAPVVLAEARMPAMAAPTSSLTLTSPRGYTVSGLGVDEALALLQVLG